MIRVTRCAIHFCVLLIFRESKCCRTFDVATFFCSHVIKELSSRLVIEVITRARRDAIRSVSFTATR